MSVLPGVGYAGPDQSHFTSRHFWEVGATSEQLRTGWLGRYLDRVGSPDNPLQGLSLDSRLQPALATAKMPVASIDGPDRTSFWTRNVWGDVETPHARGDRLARRAADRRRRRARPGDLGRPPGGAAASATAAVQAQGRPARLHEPGRIPEGRGRRVPAPARRSRRDARRRPARARRRADRAGHVRHPRRPAAASSRTASSSPPTACSHSSATSRRAASPTASSSTSGRSSAAARRRTARTAPTTAPPARAS